MIDIMSEINDKLAELQKKEIQPTILVLGKMQRRMIIHWMKYCGLNADPSGRFQLYGMEVHESELKNCLKVF